MAKSSGENACCVLTMRLHPEKWQIDVIETRFRIMEHLKNSLIALEYRKLNNLKRTRAYRDVIKQIDEASPEERKPLYKIRQQMLKDAGFSEFTFFNDMAPMQKHFKMHIASHIARKTASDVWRAFDQYLFKAGKEVHFVRRGELESIANKTLGNGMNYKSDTFIWTGLNIPCEKPKTDYEKDMLSKPIKYMRIIKKWVKTKYKYYVQFTLEGEPTSKGREIAKGRVGIDIGPSTVAVCSEKGVMLKELADRVNKIHRKKTVLQIRMDASRRATNPDNYNENGVPKRGCRWYKSKHYKELQGKLREYERKTAAIRKYQHVCLANEILAYGNEIYVEKMNFAGLQRRAKKTEKDENGRFKKKKRFGKSLANKAPAMMLTILETKAKQCGGSLVRVDTASFKASQYDHTADTYKKKLLSERFANLSNGDTVQRDMYSAFLLMNSDSTYKKTDRKLCYLTYGNFKKHQDEELSRIVSQEKQYPRSFGLKQVRSAGL